MAWAILLAIFGVAFLAFGALLALASIMPKFGGATDDGSLPVGAVLILAGISLLFYAGTLA